MGKHSPVKKPRRMKASTKVIGTGATFLALAGGSFTLGVASASDSTPLPPNVDPLGQDVTVADGTTVRIAAPSLRLTTTVDKPVVTSGSTVKYQYTLVNTGNTDYKNVRLNDDKCEPVNGFVWSGNDSDPLLNAGETWTTSCSTTVLKDQTNVARVTATPVLSGTPVSTPSATPTPTPSGTTPAAGYKDGTYTGSVVNITIPDANNETYQFQVQAVISGGKITAITIPVHTETDRTSKSIVQNYVATAASNTDPANPTFIYEAIKSQSANGLTAASTSGASYTAAGFKTSLAAALAQAA